MSRNLALDVSGAVGLGITGTLISIFLPVITRRDGLDPVGLAALAAVPFVANLLSPYAGRLGPGSPRELATMRAAGAAALLLLLVSPLPPLMLVVVLVYMLAQSLANPFQMRLWGALYPPRVLGRVFGLLGMSRAVGASLAALVGGIIADRLGAPVLIAAVGAIGVAAAVVYAGQRPASSERPAAYSATESIRALLRRPALRRLALAQGFFGGGLTAAVPLYALVHVDRLHLSLAEVGLVGIAISVATTVTYPVWGLLSDRFGPLATIRVASALGIASLVGYAFAPGLGALLPAVVILGAANASIDVGLSAFLAAEVPLAGRAAAQAGWNAVVGARGIVAAFLPSVLLSLGLVDVTSGLLLCAVSAAVGVGLFATVRPSAVRGHERIPSPEPSTASPSDGSSRPSIARPSSSASTGLQVALNHSGHGGDMVVRAKRVVLSRHGPVA